MEPFSIEIGLINQVLNEVLIMNYKVLIRLEEGLLFFRDRTFFWVPEGSLAGFCWVHV